MGQVGGVHLGVVHQLLLVGDLGGDDGHAGCVGVPVPHGHWFGDRLVDSDRHASGVSMELEERKVCHQWKLLVLTLIKGAGVLITPGLQLLFVFYCGWWRQ